MIFKSDGTQNLFNSFLLFKIDGTNAGLSMLLLPEQPRMVGGRKSISRYHDRKDKNDSPKRRGISKGTQRRNKRR